MTDVTPLTAEELVGLIKQAHHPNVGMIPSVIVLGLLASFDVVSAERDTLTAERDQARTERDAAVARADAAAETEQRFRVALTELATCSGDPDNVVSRAILAFRVRACARAALTPSRPAGAQENVDGQ